MIDRREVLQALGVGTIAASVGTVLPGGSLLARSLPKPTSVARPVELASVRLLDGPFAAAQSRNAQYLRSLEPDRLLHNFRVNAGLTPKGAVYGGWESQEPWVDIRCHGHTLGHYLSACAMQFAATGDAWFKDRAEYVVQELSACQRASKDGVICAFPDGALQLERSFRGETFIGVPWYTMHKLFAGLRDVHVHTGSAAALRVLVGLSEWLAVRAAPLSDDVLQHMLDREHGGMNEILADVHVLTGDAKYLELALRFSHQALLQPLVRGQDALDGLHSNTQIPKVIGFSRLYELTGKEDYAQAARFFWDSVVGQRSFVTGGNGDGEHFFPPSEFAQRLGSAKTMETCCTHNLLKLTRHLFAQTPTAAYADYYERALFNGILASQDPDSGMMTYFQATRPGYVKLYCTPFDSFWCCTGSGMENHTKYGDSIYYQDDEGLLVNLFIASTLNWRARGIELTQRTSFPKEARTRISIASGGPTRFALRLRHPAWCREATASVNGKPHSSSRQPSSYLTIEREWRDGDEVELSVPMHLHTEPLPGVQTIVAALYGPIVLAGRMGTHGLAPGADLIVNERLSGTMLNEPTVVPDWPGSPQSMLAALEATGDPLQFTARGFAGSRTIEFMPYYALAHERYNLYWRTARPS